ncbi:MAG: Glu-tRNA(Gln) amidotransferase subunit GatD [Candidatus Pacearchaeota archaeon]
MQIRDAKVGDYVEVVFMKKSYKGVLLETQKSEKGIVLIKLDTGYNIGFNKKDILEIKVLKKFEQRFSEDFIKVKKDAEKPNVALIITGGTISSSYDSKTGGVAPLTKPEDFFKFYPEIFEKINVFKIDVVFMKPSENINFNDWKKIAKVSEKHLNDPNIKGVIITHGTDTLHYTSSALSFFLRNLNKPVVLTYSQRSIDRASSDAKLNLQCSAIASISDIAEVVVVGHSSVNDDYCYVMPGTKIRKMHTSRRDAFKVVNGRPIAKIYIDKIEFLSNYKSRSNNKVKLDSKFEKKVALIKVYPGQKPSIFDYYLKDGYKGIVLELFGLGHPPDRSWVKKIREVRRKGMIICATSQTIYGRLDPFVYSTGRELLNAGVIYLEDMLSETAFVKLGWVLGHKEWSKYEDKVRENMLTNFAGEFNPRLDLNNP